MLTKKLGHFGIFRMEFSNNPNKRQVKPLTGNVFIYLTTSAALIPAAEIMIVWGAPFFLDADHSLVELPEKRSRKPGRLSRVLGLSQDVVSWIAVAKYEINKTPIRNFSGTLHTWDMFIFQLNDAQITLILPRPLSDIVS